MFRINNQPTLYRLSVAFEGDEPLNATAYHIINGTTYAVCTTTHYGFKPAVNSTFLTVQPQSTEATQPTKTPEQMEQEARDDGWLQLWPEFSWSYPWFRLHVKININPKIEIAFNPVLPGGEFFNWTGLDLFSAIVEDIWQDIVLDLLGVFAGYVLAKGVGIWNLPAAVLIEIGKGIVQGAFLFGVFWYDQMKVLATAAASIIMGLIAIATNIGEAFVNNLMNLIAAPARAALYLISYGMIVAAQPIKHLRTPIDYLETVIDFTIGGFALLRYLGRI